MQASWFFQFRLLLGQNLKAEVSDKEKFLSPVLFALVVLTLFSFVFEPPAPAQLVPYVVLQCALSILLSLQIAYPKIYGNEEQDQVLLVLSTYDISFSAWYMSKLALAILVSLIITCASALFTLLFNPQILSCPLSPLLFATLLLALTGMAAMGVLLSALTRSASGKELLFPLLYYPLTLPVLLAACQVASNLLGGNDGAETYKWLALLGGFNIVYVILGLVLFEDLI